MKKVINDCCEVTPDRVDLQKHFIFSTSHKTRSSEMNVAPWLRQIMLEVKRLLRLEKWMTFGQIYTLMMILAVTGYWL